MKIVRPGLDLAVERGSTTPCAGLLHIRNNPSVLLSHARTVNLAPPGRQQFRLERKQPSIEEKKQQVSLSEESGSDITVELARAGDRWLTEIRASPREAARVWW